MKTVKSILTAAVVILFSVYYTAYAGQYLNGNNGAAFEDSTMTNHNHGGSSMMNENHGDAMMNHGDMMAMMQKCQSMAQKMRDMQKQMSSENCCAANGHVTNKNDNSSADPGNKKGSYGYFQQQRLKNKNGE